MAVGLRAKWVVATYGTSIAAVLAVVGLLAVGGAVDAYVNPPTDRVTETVDEFQVSTSMETSATVTGDTPLYRQGATLSDQSAYFYNATPSVTVGVRTEVPEDRPVTVSQRLTLRHVAARDGATFWTTRRVLGATDRTVESGAVTTEATIDMRALRESVARWRQEIGSVGGFRTLLRLEVTYEADETTADLATTAPVVLTDRAYWFDGSLDANRTHRTTAERTVTREPDMGSAGGLAGAGVGSLLLALGVVALQRREFDLDAIETELTRSRYEEWISRGEIPSKSEKQYVRIDTLEDLVDIAIDSNKRVIHDETYDAFGVVDADVVYYHSAGDAEFDRWLGV